MRDHLQDRSFVETPDEVVVYVTPPLLQEEPTAGYEVGTVEETIDDLEAAFRRTGELDGNEIETWIARLRASLDNG